MLKSINLIFNLISFYEKSQEDSHNLASKPDICNNELLPSTILICVSPMCLINISFNFSAIIIRLQTLNILPMISSAAYPRRHSFALFYKPCEYHRRYNVATYLGQASDGVHHKL